MASAAITIRIAQVFLPIALITYRTFGGNRPCGFNARTSAIKIYISMAETAGAEFSAASMLITSLNKSSR